MENIHLLKQPESFYEQECQTAFLFFKTKSVTQVYITDMQGKT